VLRSTYEALALRARLCLIQPHARGARFGQCYLSSLGGSRLIVYLLQECLLQCLKARTQISINVGSNGKPAVMFQDVMARLGKQWRNRGQRVRFTLKPTLKNARKAVYHIRVARGSGALDLADGSANIKTPRQQNLWVDSGSGRRPSV
jgi:hypothetical protein